MMAHPGECVGIDLGTTSSAIAAVLGETPEIVPDGDDHGTMPSRVAFGSDGTARVGRHAIDAHDALASSKRLIGRSFEDAKQQKSTRALFGKSLKNNGGAASLIHNGVDASPVDVASHILSALLDQSHEQCGVRADRAVLGVPAHFTDAQREATKLAAERAGIEKVRLLEEPVAAALAYGVGQGDDDELVLVFDLGGGTLDVSVLRVGGGTAEVLSAAGEPWLGGDDFDVAIAAFLASREKLDNPRSPALLNAARSLKERLTVTKQSEVEFEGAVNDTLSLSRREMEKACAELLERMHQPIIMACMQAQVALPGAAEVREDDNRDPRQQLRKPGRGGGPSSKGQKIDTVLRVGAASRMPAVGSMLEALIGVQAPIAKVKPEHAVALGCAVQAGVLDGSIEQFDVFSPMEAALIRGIRNGRGVSQRERTGEPSGSRRKKKRRAGGLPPLAKKKANNIKFVGFESE